MDTIEELEEVIARTKKQHPELNLHIARTIVLSLKKGIEESTRREPFDFKRGLSKALKLFVINETERPIYKKLVISYFGNKIVD